MKKIWNLTKGDIFSLWKTNKLLFIMILLYEGLYCAAGNDAAFLSVLAIVLGGMFSYNSIAYDEKSGWNRFILTTAYSRKEYVLGKYLMALTGILAGFVITFLTDNLAAALGRVDSYHRLTPVLPVTVAATLLMIGFALPLSFRFGMEKARLISLLTVALICGTAGGTAAIADGFSWTGDLSFVNLIVLAVGVAIFCFSAFLSVKIYSRRQL